MTYQIPLSMDKSYLKKFVAIYLLSKVVSFFFTIIGPLLFLIVIIGTHSETDISEATSIALGGTAAFLVNVLFTLKYKQWSDFFKDLEDLKKFGKPASYQKTVNFLNRFGYISIFGSFMVIIIYGLTAWYNTKLIKEINEDFDQISPVLVPIWLPFGANNLTAGTIIFTMQIIFTGLLTGQPLLIQSFIIYESTEILICYINHLNDNFKKTFEASSRVEMRNRLRFCIGYHVHLLKLGYRLSSLVKYTVGHMSLLSALVCGCMANQMLT
ncbi:uncharacterized protein LOC108916830, partial [Anoplophora glabripennis]|uniref:uncharacterized protein LOC108916830 n=1 Tax=Anoplophora glabripennis TaxID=217634 RepID=UPI0008750BA0